MGPSRHTQTAAQKAYERLSKRAGFLTIDWSLVNNLADLQFQVEHAIDLYEEGDHHAEITTPRMLHRAKMLHSEITIARNKEMRRVG